MSIANWPARRIGWLWAAVAAYFTAVLVFGAVSKSQRDREWEREWVARFGPRDTTTSAPLTPQQQARADSLVDSLKQMAKAFVESPRGRGAVQQFMTSLGEALPSWPVLWLVLLVALSPLLVAVGVTMAWLRARRAIAAA